MRTFLPIVVLIAPLVMVWTLIGCDKLSSGDGASPQTGHQGGSRVAPPPIAAPIGNGPHPPASGELAQHPAGVVMQQINFYKDRLEENPKDLEALIALGNANFDIQRFDQAKQLYLRALEVDPENIMVRTDLASCYRNLGDVEQALNELNQALLVDEHHDTALYNLGVILLNDKQDVQGAISTWEKLLLAHPDLIFASELKTKIEELRSEKSEPATPAEGGG